MSANARAIVIALAALCVFGGTLAMFAGDTAGGAAALVVGVFIAVSVAFEGRYGRPGQQPTPASIDWQRTAERFIDDETGQPIEVWMDPLTGERRYEPAGSDPRLPRP